MPLRLDKLLLDILDWLEKALDWRRNKKGAAKPYEVLRVYPGVKGVLRLLQRETPRAVYTLEFQPLRKTGEPLQNRIHIYCDHLEKIPGDPTPRVAGKSHRVQILTVAPVLSKEGYVFYEILFRQDYQFQCTAYRDQHATVIVLAVGLQLLRLPYTQINWAFEIEATAKQIMGGKWAKP